MLSFTLLFYSHFTCSHQTSEHADQFTFINSVHPIAPVNFAEKQVLKLVKPFSGHCLAKRATFKTCHKAANRLHIYLAPSDPDAKYWLLKFGHVQKAKWRDSVWV